MIRRSMLAFASVLVLAACGPSETPAPVAAAPEAVDLSVKADERTPLDEYVGKPDAAYKWELVGTYPAMGRPPMCSR